MLSERRSSSPATPLLGADGAPALPPRSSHHHAAMAAAMPGR